MNDSPDTPPRAQLPSQRPHTGDDSEMLKAIEGASHAGAQRAMAAYAEEQLKVSKEQAAQAADLRHVSVRLAVVESTRVILPFALAIAALGMSAANTALIIWLHVRGVT